MKLDWTKLVISIAVCEAAGLIGSIFTLSSIPTWYASLVKPSFSPPNWIFGHVWTILYALMGISLYLVWEKGFNRKTKFAFYLFGTQLALNSLWSILFFGLRSPLYAFIEIVALWISIVLTIFSFYRISKTSAILLLPYIAWVSFALILNLAIFQLNG
ncbi:MAG: tryptophan-rich sensory protein [Candidatus Aenigmarchaeota archaeon]|nr:tryptophan-rich sensory protein [Candidatus Aenigmarchaeota archaeon]